MKGIQALMSDYADGFNLHESEVKANDSEKIDALEVIQISCSCTFIYAYTCFWRFLLLVVLCARYYMVSFICIISLC